MSDVKRFAELSLSEDSLSTPAGEMPLAEITRAEFVREVVRDGQTPTTKETSGAAVAGGAVLGGVVFGAAGAVAGGLLGSTVKEDVPGNPTFHTASVQIVFETPDLAYAMDIARAQEVEADKFVHAVKKAVKHSS